MKPCPPPSGSLLPASHRPFLENLLKILKEHEYSQTRLEPLLQKIVNEFAQLCSTDDDLLAWYDELDLWVRWHRIPAYWLTFIFQRMTQVKKSTYHFLACDLYAVVQSNFADDLALSSLETAYHGYMDNQAILGTAYKPLKHAIESKLDYNLKYYRYWSRPFDYVKCNPCADHIYTYLTQLWLEKVGKELDDHFLITHADSLICIINQCNNDDFAYYGVLARRFLGLLQDSRGQYEVSEEQFRLALSEANRLDLDTEIGHLHRLLGCALRSQGKSEEACHQFKQAYEFEHREPNYCHTLYWQVLSAYEQADTIMRIVGHPVKPIINSQINSTIIIDELEKLRPALKAYYEGRKYLNGHMTMSSPFPLARGAKQQIFRSFSQNSIKVACLLKNVKCILAEVENSGPREISVLMTENAAVLAQNPTSLTEFRRNRAHYYRTLNTTPSQFEDYLANIVKSYHSNREFLVQWINLAKQLIHTQQCNEIVEKTLALSLPNTVFLMFHIGTHASTMVLLDMSSGNAAPYSLDFGETQLRAIHDEFQNKMESQDVKEKMDALDKLLSVYADMFGAVMEPVLQFLPGKHLKIFPRLQMNVIPFHALRFQGKYLIDHCATISYGQTLGLFLQNHSRNDAQYDTLLRVVIGDNVKAYENILPNIHKVYAKDCREEYQPSWSALMNSVVEHQARDTLFACHGEYYGEDSEIGHLSLDATKPVSFSQVFEELDLRGCRSVIMGACESGLVRSTIGAEYIGLPSAMLSSGVRYVIGALWKIPRRGTAVLINRFLELIQDGSHDVCTALCVAQRELIHYTRDDYSKWVHQHLTTDSTLLEYELNQIAKMDAYPFSHPYHWAGLYIIGDI